MIFVVLDGESIGLHGETFAAGYVVINDMGENLEEGLLACDPAHARGARPGRTWVAANVPELPFLYPAARPEDVRRDFWRVWDRWRKQGATLWADCQWPVEANFLSACIRDNTTSRLWEGPYPLHEIGTLALALGRDPLADLDRLPDELPKHNPLCDARQSARILVEYLVALNIIDGPLLP